MPPRLSFTDSDDHPEADDYQWAEFNLPPALCNTADAVDDIGLPFTVDPGPG